MAKELSVEQVTALRDDTAQLQKAYQIAFAGPSGAIVLEDLGRFCRANEPCWSEDQRHHARLEGRREVWLRIQQQIKLMVEELLQRRLGDSHVVVKIDPEDEEHG